MVDPELEQGDESDIDVNYRAPKTEEQVPVAKWGALIFRSPDGPGEHCQMHGGKETFPGSITSLFPPEQRELWEKWLGTIRWGNIDRADRVVLLRLHAISADRLGELDKRIQGELDRAWIAYLLSGAVFEQTAWMLGGDAAGVDPTAALLSVNWARQEESIVLASYTLSKRYNEFQADAGEDTWRQYGTWTDQSWLPLWVEVDELLAQPRPTILGLSLLAYTSAWGRGYLDFSIPDFVRAAEGLIALPEHTGRRLFMESALNISPRLRTDPYVGADIDALLVDLYDRRSASVHGDAPFKDLQDLGDAGEERAAQLRYVAEVLARDALLVALRYPDKLIFKTRSDLQRAWEDGRFPPGAPKRVRQQQSTNGKGGAGWQKESQKSSRKPTKKVSPKAGISS